MKNKTTQEQLIELYEQQIQDLVMMSKIELGDDVIAKIKELKSQIHKQESAVEWLINAVEANMGDIPLEVQEQAKEMFKQQMIEFGNACANQVKMIDGEFEMVKSPEELYTQVYRGEMNMGETTMITPTTNTNPGTTMKQQVQIYINTINAFGEELSDVETDTLYDFAGWVDSIDEFYGS